MSWSRWLATPTPRPDAVLFRFDHDWAFAFAPQPDARPAEPMPLLAACLPWFVPDDTLPVMAALQAPPEPGPRAVASVPVTTAETALPPAAPETLAPVATQDLPAPTTPDLPGAPPRQSAEELALFDQFAGMYGDFSGDQALVDLLGSDWAAENQWQSAGGAPLG